MKLNSTCKTNRAGYSLLLVSLLCVIVSFRTGDLWMQADSITGPGRYYTFSFSLNGKGYVIGGAREQGYIGDIACFDTATGNWTNEGDFPLKSIYSPTGFVIGDSVFLVGGHTGTKMIDGVWMYSATTKQWREIGKAPKKGVYDACGFSVDNKGYVFGGSFGGPPYSNALWQYDSKNNEWIKMAPLPGQGRSASRSFVLGGEVYIIGGLLDGNWESTTAEVWKYSPSTNKWTQLKNFPGGKRMGGEAFACNGEGYYSCGFRSDKQFNDLWRYNKSEDSWVRVSSYPGEEHRGGYCFVIGTSAFIGGGVSSDKRCFNDFWVFKPALQQ